MLDSKTLLILGAGASSPYFLPTADELCEIACFGRRSTELWGKLKLPVTGYDQLQKVINETCDGQAISVVKRDEFRQRLNKSDGITIDTWIKENMDFADVATISIAGVLLTCEREHFLHGDWYRRLGQAIAANATFAPDRLKIITFNYDRSLQFWLARSYQGYRNKDYSELQKVVEICHVYGDLGELYLGKRRVEYGGCRNLAYSASRLQLAIGNEEPDKIALCRHWTMWAKRVYFLGLSYWPQHLEMLDTKKLLIGTPTYACGCGIAQNTWVRIRKRHFDPSCGVPDSVIDLNADEFTRQYPF